MYKGTTPALNLFIDTDLTLSAMTEIWVTIKDSDGTPYNWTKSDLLINDDAKKLTLTLTQVETLALTDGPAQIQVRMLTSDAQALATNISCFFVNDVLKGGVISG